MKTYYVYMLECSDGSFYVASSHKLRSSEDETSWFKSVVFVMVSEAEPHCQKFLSLKAPNSKIQDLSWVKPKGPKQIPILKRLISEVVILTPRSLRSGGRTPVNKVPNYQDPRAKTSTKFQEPSSKNQDPK